MDAIPHMSEVRRATDDSGRAVAVKSLSPELSAIPAMRARWAAATPRLEAFRHPAAVPVLSHAEDRGRLAVTLAWIDGAEDLRTRVRREGPLALGETAAALEPAAAAIDALHDAGITYADAKTGNVLLAGDGRVLLAHAWLSFPRDDPAPSRFLDPERFAGTIDHAAPEVIEGGLPSLGSDVYGLACAAFECLTGRTPFARGNEDATLEAHLEEEPPSSGSGRAVDAVLRRALAKADVDRHATPSAFVAALRGAAR